MGEQTNIDKDEKIKMFSSFRIKKLIQYAISRNINSRTTRDRFSKTNLLSLDISDCIDSKFTLSTAQMEQGETITSSKFYKKAVQNTDRYNPEINELLNRNSLPRADLRKAIGLIQEHPEGWLFRNRLDQTRNPTEYFKMIKS